MLSIPFFAMLLNAASDSVNWSPFDFIIMGALVFGAVFAYEFLKVKVSKRSHRLILALLLFVFFLLTWAEMAVGVFDSPIAGS